MNNDSIPVKIINDSVLSFGEDRPPIILRATSSRMLSKEQIFQKEDTPVLREEPKQELSTREGSPDPPLEELLTHLPIEEEIMVNVESQLEWTTTGEEFAQIVSSPEGSHLTIPGHSLKELFYVIISVDEDDGTNDEIIKINENDESGPTDEMFIYEVVTESQDVTNPMLAVNNYPHILKLCDGQIIHAESGERIINISYFITTNVLGELESPGTDTASLLSTRLQIDSDYVMSTQVDINPSYQLLSDQNQLLSLSIESSQQSNQLSAAEEQSSQYPIQSCNQAKTCLHTRR